jgi:hypothetical protein
MHRFAMQDPTLNDKQRAHVHGNVGFKPGKWWINSTFAFRSGIIDSACMDGGICYSNTTAFALVLRGDEETNAPDPSKFTYRCGLTDRGRFRLTSANFRSRYPVRVLRDQRMASIWAPRAGIRYDGLFDFASVWFLTPCSNLVQIQNCWLDSQIVRAREESWCCCALRSPFRVRGKLHQLG